MAPKKKRVIIVDDHPLLRERLTQLINHQPDLMVTGEAESAEKASELIQKSRSDLAIIDITLKGSSGLELIKDAKSLPIDLPMLVLSMHEESLLCSTGSARRRYRVYHKTSNRRRSLTGHQAGTSWGNLPFSSDDRETFERADRYRSQPYS